MPMYFNDVAIVSIKGNDYRIHFWYMSKNDAINIMKNSNLKKSESLLFFLFFLFLFFFILGERAKNKYRELSEEEKNIKREYGRNRYHNMSEEKKQRLKEHQKNYREAKKHLS